MNKKLTALETIETQQHVIESLNKLLDVKDKILAKQDDKLEIAIRSLRRIRTVCGEGSYEYLAASDALNIINGDEK